MSTRPAQLCALHGFLGVPEDWSGLLSEYPIEAPDLFLEPTICPLNTWAKLFNAKTFESFSGKKILMGYSLGGRLALHALIHKPEKWDAAVIISAHPGLKTEQEKMERWREDEIWANRFESDEWNSLMFDWEKRAVFETGVFRFKRLENNYHRPTLAKSLRLWSLGKQENLLPHIEKLPMPILWMTGSSDHVYTALSKQVKLKHQFSRVEVIPEAGHRLPWQASEMFLKKCEIFFDDTGVNK